ncbi:MAG: alpha/beta hydrolase [Actinobacteria bacterium]|nr:alpha/beta hydrolase [Actinomycetota bacterium]
MEIVRAVHETPRHRTSYLAAGPEDGPLIVFVHGWPDLALSWRNQLPVFAGLGFRAVAPDMRGYGDSSAPAGREAYCQREIVADMLELLDGLGRESAIWVGHDWGAPVVWNIASHHPDRCRAVAGLSVPYHTLEYGLEALIELVDRGLYPADEFPAGQWDYMLFYEERFERASAVFEADVEKTVKALFRSAGPEFAGKPAYTAKIRRQGGWFGGRDAAPDLPLDPAVLSAAEARLYVEALSRTGFAGGDAWYVNHAANRAYAGEAVAGGRLEMPVLFLVGAYEYTCDCLTSRLAEPMGEHCADLTTATLPSGHWLAQERPAEVNSALAAWLAGRVGALPILARSQPPVRL